MVVKGQVAGNIGTRGGAPFQPHSSMNENIRSLPSRLAVLGGQPVSGQLQETRLGPIEARPAYA